MNGMSELVTKFVDAIHPQAGGFRGAQMYREITVPTGADYIRFDIFSDTPGNGDVLQVSIGDTLLYDLADFDVHSPIMDSGPIDVGNLAGTTNRLLFSFTGAGDLGDSVYLSNFRFYKLNTSVLIAGDYDGNGVVDAADYVVWRNAAGTTGVELAADGNGDGLVNTADYELWRANFGRSNSSGSQAAIPEPASIGFLATWLVMLGRIRRKAHCTSLLETGASC
jgi:hypothetical protein